MIVWTLILLALFVFWVWFACSVSQASCEGVGLGPILATPMGAAEKIYDEMIDLFARGGGAGSVLAFRPSAQAQARVAELFERNREGPLTEDDRQELDRFVELERLMQLVKARARRHQP